MKPLADKFLEAAADTKYDAFTHDMCQGVASDIKSSQRFMVSQESREAGRRLLITKPSSLVTASQWARPPFERSWFEWETPEHPNPLIPIKARVNQIGCMVECKPNTKHQVFRFYTAWSYDTSPSNNIDKMTKRLLGKDPTFKSCGLGVSSVEIGIDFSVPPGAPLIHLVGKEWVSPTRHTDKMLEDLRNDKYNNVHYAIEDLKERDALDKLVAPIRWRLRHDEVSRLQFDAVMGLNPKEGLVSAIDDARDEVGALMATLILLNSRNCVSLDTVQPSPGLVKARLKRGNKPPPLDYTVINLRMGKVQKNMAEAHGMTHAEAMAHIVRGHFKTRKTGVFWWSDFMRGRGPTKPRKEYHVEA